MQSRRRYAIKQLPKFLIFHFARFTKNNFYSEKNPTIVHIPVKDLELKGQFALEGAAAAEGAVTKRLPVSAAARPRRASGDAECSTSADVAARAAPPVRRPPRRASRGEKPKRDAVERRWLRRYDLLANACHDLPTGLGKDGQQDPLQHGSYRVHTHQQSSDQWYEIQDLHVSETMPQLIGLSESLITIYKRRDV